jgi:hypothetical protein
MMWVVKFTSQPLKAPGRSPRTYFKGSSEHPRALLDGLEKRKSVPLFGVRTPNRPRYTYCKNMAL